MRNQKQFEISFNRSVYFGSYEFEDGKLVIDDVHTFDSDEQRVEIDSINNKETFDKVYSLLEKKHSDEIEMVREEILAERESRLRDF